MAFLTNKKICVTGGAGFLGRVVCEKLRTNGVGDIFVPRRSEYDLTRPDRVERLFDAAQPDIVIHLAAEVGGIGANAKNPGRFCYANLSMGMHLIEQARIAGVKKFVLIGTVCGYPKHCPVPFREDDLWSGFPEETNAPYGVAKRTLGVLLDAYQRQYGLNGVYLLPVNLYGPGDNFDPETSHVIPALIRKFLEAAGAGVPEVSCWGTGEVSREFLFVDDAADAIVLATDLHNDPAPMNIGAGQEITIAELAGTIARLCGFKGKVRWDETMQSGQPRRKLDTSRARNILGWEAKVDFEHGLQRTIEWWRSQPTVPRKHS